MICGAGDAQCCLGADGAGRPPPSDLQDQFHEFVEHIDRRLLVLEQSLSEFSERLEAVEEDNMPESDDEDVFEEEEEPQKLYKCHRQS